MEQKRLLIIDDEPDLCEILSFNLSTAGYTVDTALSGQEAMKKDVKQYDLILLDVMMPVLSGFDVARQLKLNPATASIPIIFLTALGGEPDMLHGFELGADDYISKPFSTREVLARVKAVLNRVTSPDVSDQSNILRYKDLIMDLGRMVVTVDGKPISLTRTEFDLLKVFLENPSQVFSRQDLLERVWPHDVIVTDRTVDVNITRMRKKIGQYSSCIITRHGFGYLFAE